MQTSNIKIQNNGTYWDFTFEHSNNRTDERLCKRMVYEFMAYYDLCRRIKAKGFKATLPFDITIVREGKQVLDTRYLKTEARMTLKLINNAKGRQMFIGRMLDIADYAMRPTTDKELEKKLLAH